MPFPRRTLLAAGLALAGGLSYGLGWFAASADGRPIRFAWGYGGQMLHLVPDLDLTVATTSEPTVPSGRTGYVGELHALLTRRIIPAVA